MYLHSPNSQSILPSPSHRPGVFTFILYCMLPSAAHSNRLVFLLTRFSQSRNHIANPFEFIKYTFARFCLRFAQHHFFPSLAICLSALCQRIHFSSFFSVHSCSHTGSLSVVPDGFAIVRSFTYLLLSFISWHFLCISIIVPLDEQIGDCIWTHLSARRNETFSDDFCFFFHFSFEKKIIIIRAQLAAADFGHSSVSFSIDSDHLLLLFHVRILHCMVGRFTPPYSDDWWMGIFSLFRLIRTETTFVICAPCQIDQLARHKKIPNEMSLDEEKNDKKKYLDSHRWWG